MMTIRWRKAGAWAGLLILTLLALCVVAYPILQIMPFKAQTPEILSRSYILRRWSPVITVVIFGLALVPALWLIVKTRSRWLKPAPLLFLLPLGTLIWVSRQNHFERLMFNPLAESRFARPAEAGFVAPPEMVLGVEINGDAAAYPVRQVAYHHVVHDTVGGVPLVATY